MAPRRKRQRKKKKTTKRQRGGSIMLANKGIEALTKLAMPSSKQAFKDFWSGATFKRAWNNLRGNHPDPRKGVAYSMKNGKLPKKPEGCKVLTEARNRKGQVVSYSCWR